MNNIIGTVVTGEDFFGREDDLRLIWGALSDGNHITMLAPRRVGKTSLAHRVGEEAKKQGWKFVFMDAQGCRDELSFLEELFERLKMAGLKVPMLAKATQAVTWFRKSLPGKFQGYGMTLEIGGSAEKETVTLEKLVHLLFRELEASGEKVLIAVDELPVLLMELEGVEDKSRLKAFLNWFRGLRLENQKHVRWLLLGSVGLDTFLEARKLTAAINDLQTNSLGAFPKETAIRFLKTLGNGYELEMPDEVCDAVLTEMGWPLPFFLQLIFQQLRENAMKEPRSLSVSSVTAACDQLLAPAYYKHFEPWRGRLGEGLGLAECGAAKAVLKHLCTKTKGDSREALLAKLKSGSPHKPADELESLLITVLGVLERDGYLLRQTTPVNETRYAFRSFLLRKYWHIREVA